MNKLGSAGAPGSGNLLFADPPAEQQLLTDMPHEHERRALTALRERQGN